MRKQRLDYAGAAANAGIPRETVRELERRAGAKFPDDPTMRDLDVLEAIQAMAGRQVTLSEALTSRRPKGGLTGRARDPVAHATRS